MIKKRTRLTYRQLQISCIADVDVGFFVMAKLYLKGVDFYPYSGNVLRGLFYVDPVNLCS